MTNKTSYCSNCGKYGHENSRCSEPIISIGILCLKLDEQLQNIILRNLPNISKRYEEIDNFNYGRLSNLNKIQYYKNKIQILLIKRKHSLNYIEFIRGLYEVNDTNKLVSMFKLMCVPELNEIRKFNFDELWGNLWQKTAKKKKYKKEYLSSKDKFNSLVESGKLNEILSSITCIYDTPEWEIPKGRRNNHEKNLDCAKRELYEETNINEDNYIILKNLFSLHDTFTGTNGIDYKHIFYTALLNTDEKLDINSNNEVSEIKLCSWDEINTLIRPYHENKINMINEVFLFILNLCEDYSNNNSKMEEMNFII